ncbi:hypothetical protein EGW08_021805 [Elysia chlorotica]|uniref:SURP motif domain-containing protein n=1 Tax=Elysia chlorotica TaxID=188477 RepID=A0A3S0ZAF7_ELYCH|nr:hypothetical protein EGW08_021805 [Elysia chlorotica]
MSYLAGAWCPPGQSSVSYPRPRDQGTQAARRNVVRNTESLVLQWIPAHCRIEGNERADRLAKEGSVLEQIESDLTYREVKSIIKTSLNKKWKKSHPEYNKQDGVYCLSRRGQTTIFRLRTGHNRLKHHIHKIFKVGETDLCLCGQAAETAQHVLQDCRIYSNVRQSIWRERIDMHTKLYGPLPELEKTVAFIARLGSEFEESVGEREEEEDERLA